MLSIYQNDNKRERPPTDRAAENKKTTRISAWSALCRNKSKVKSTEIPACPSTRRYRFDNTPYSDRLKFMTQISPRLSPGPPSRYASALQNFRPRRRAVRIHRCRLPDIRLQQFFTLLRSQISKSHFLRYCSVFDKWVN